MDWHNRGAGTIGYWGDCGDKTKKKTITIAVAGMLAGPDLGTHGGRLSQLAAIGGERLAAMGGIISGYNYGNWGLGCNHTIGPVAAPVVMMAYKHVGPNIVVIPPIPSDDLPFTLRFQVRYRF